MFLLLSSERKMLLTRGVVGNVGGGLVGLVVGVGSLLVLGSPDG